jgi:hypothetical protein
LTIIQIPSEVVFSRRLITGYPTLGVGGKAPGIQNFVGSDEIKA